MRLIIATSSFPTHPKEAINAGVFVYAMADAIGKQGHTVSVFTPEKGEEIRGFDFEVKTFAWGGNQKVLTRLNPKNPQELFLLGRLMLNGRQSFAKFVRQFQPDGILAAWVIPSGFWAYGLNVPLAVWALGSDIWGVGRYPFGKFITKKVLRKADHVFANSFFLIDEIEKMAGKKAEFLAASRNLPVDKIPPVQLDGKGPHFLFIGRWDKAKGPDILLEAMALVREKIPDARLYLFGGGPMENLLRERIEKNDLKETVKIYGYADPDTATAYLKACDVLVMPSRIESVPVLLSDALLCGCPVAATDVGDLGKIVKDNGIGLVCEPENSSALASLMEEMTKGEISARMRYNQAICQSKFLFDLNKSASRCIDVLNIALPRRHV